MRILMGVALIIVLILLIEIGVWGSNCLIDRITGGPCQFNDRNNIIPHGLHGTQR